MTETTSTTSRARVGGPRHGVFLTLTGLIVLWVVPQLVVGLGSGTLTVDGRAANVQTLLDPLAAASAGLTLVMVVGGVVAELRGDRRRARMFVAGSAVTGLLLVIPTLLAVLALLVVPRPRSGTPGS